MKKIFTTGSIFIILMVVVVQLLPIGRDHTNPPVTSEPAWDSPLTRQLAARACFDCHSNESIWPWYSNIAPFSWLVQRDVDEGRSVLNFSEWNTSRHEEVEEIAEVVAEGEMPPASYLPLHPQAQLTASERKQLIQGLQNTFLK